MTTLALAQGCFLLAEVAGAFVVFLAGLMTARYLRG